MKTAPSSVTCWQHWSLSTSPPAKFIDDDLLPFCRQLVVEVQSHEAIKAQTLGEGLQAHRLEKLNHYETHLDRKFERTLAMLLKLKDLRRGA